MMTERRSGGACRVRRNSSGKASTSREMDAAFATLARERPDAIFVEARSGRGHEAPRLGTLEDTITTEQKIIRAKVGLLELQATASACRAGRKRPGLHPRPDRRPDPPLLIDGVKQLRAGVPSGSIPRPFVVGTNRPTQRCYSGASLKSNPQG
jgi:hypothetical protein